MGISRDSRHKRRCTGGKRAIHQKKRKYELGRPPANTKLGGHRVHTVRVMGGYEKQRALRLDFGNFAWTSERHTLKSKIISVVYHPTSNELVRTNTITKSTVVLIDATPFRDWYYRFFGIDLGKKAHDAEQRAQLDEKLTPEDIAAREKRGKSQKLLPAMAEQLAAGRVLAVISSRPGQMGRADGYILEGKELEFYKKKLEKKRK